MQCRIRWESFPGMRGFASEADARAGVWGENCVRDQVGIQLGRGEPHQAAS